MQILKAKGLKRTLQISEKNSTFASEFKTNSME